MKKDLFYLAKTGKPVTFGDVIRGEFHQNGINQTTFITLNPFTVPMLVQSGVLLTTPPTPALPQAIDVGITLGDVIRRIAKKLGWKPEKVEGYLNGVDKLMPMSAFNIVARELAIMIDEKYPDHINKSEKIFCISSLDGRIHEVCKAHIKNYRNFAAFRTIDDAKFACRILREPLKAMFSGQ